MFKLLLKYMIGFILVGLISVFILYLISSKLFELSFEQTTLDMNQGIFHSLQSELSKYPEDQWPTVLTQFQPINANPAAIVLISKLHLNQNELNKLMRGEIIIKKSRDAYYFGYGVAEIFLYQRISQSNQILMLGGIPLSWVAQKTSGWMVYLIRQELEHTPSIQWQNTIQQLSSAYKVPLSILDINNPSIPITIKKSLARNSFVLGAPDHAGKINFAYFTINHGKNVVQIGPIPYPFYPQYQLYILVCIFVVIVIFAIIFFTFIFSRNLEKIYKITDRYSHGDFSEVPAFSQHSTLRTLYDNILKMGSKIQNLMTVQRNLIRFVAHESRTPISTMLFAIEDIEKENLSEKIKKNIQSIKEDLVTLNDLVGDFLHYVKFSDQDLIVKKQEVNINQWLQNCIQKFESAPKLIYLNYTIDKNSVFAFDPTLMRHVINNLITNAIKYSYSQVQISATFENNTLTIHVEDDGPGIEDADKEKIFTPFFQIQSSEQSGFGLGLTIAEAIVKKHHGILSVSDSKLGGTCFTVILIS